MNMTNVDIWNLQALAIDFVIITILLVSLKYLKGLLSNVKATDEIAQKNNAAFGVSFAGGILALGIMLTGVSSGDTADSLVNEALNMFIFGVIGMVMILAGRLVQDKFVLTQFDIHGELAKGNLACALVDVGHMLSVAIVVRAAMIWVPTSDWNIIPLLIVAFILAQVVMLISSLYRIKLFKARNTNRANCLQSAIVNGNSALAFRYASFLIGSSLAVTAATGMVTISADNQWLDAATWSLVSIVMVVLFALFVTIVKKLVLTGVDVAVEVDQEENLGVAAIESALFISIGLIMMTLLG